MSDQIENLTYSPVHVPVLYVAPKKKFEGQSFHQKADFVIINDFMAFEKITLRPYSMAVIFVDM